MFPGEIGQKILFSRRGKDEFRGWVNIKQVLIPKGCGVFRHYQGLISVCPFSEPTERGKFRGHLNWSCKNKYKSQGISTREPVLFQANKARATHAQITNSECVFKAEKKVVWHAR